MQQMQQLPYYPDISLTSLFMQYCTGASGNRIGDTFDIIVSIQGNQDLVISVHESESLHVCSVMVPHLRQPQLH